MCCTTIDQEDHREPRSSKGSQERKGGTEENPALTDAKENLRKGVFYGALSIALLTMSFSLTLPHMQSRRDALGCDSMCLGSMLSARSGLSLVGSALVGRWSDSTGWQSWGGARKMCMLIGSFSSLIGLLVAANTFSIQGMWVSLIPGSLFGQNFNVVKALFSDYYDAIAAASPACDTDKSPASSSDRAGSVGLVGMAAGLAFMAGPLLGSTVLQTYEQALWVAVLSTMGSFVLILYIPNVKVSIGKAGRSANESNSILDFLSVPAAKTPAALLFMAVRTCMALAYHIFQTIWTASLKERFNFGPSDHGKFMSFIGLTYAISQGFVAKFLLKHFGTETKSGRVRVILTCCILLGVGRYIAFQTSSLIAVYTMFAFIVMSLGVVNTVLTADTSQLAPSDEIGGLFGILAAVESGAGMVGPVLGGALTYIDPIQAPLLTVVALYCVVFALVAWGYERLVLRSKAVRSGKLE